MSDDGHKERAERSSALPRRVPGSAGFTSGRIRRGALPPEPAEFAGPSGDAPAQSEPARVQAARADPARTEPARTEPARPEPARPEPVRPGAAKATDSAGAGLP